MSELLKVPKLEKIEIDVDKKIFKINGIDFGHDCSSFSICCDTTKGFLIEMKMDTTVTLANYDLRTGEKC